MTDAKQRLVELIKDRWTVTENAVTTSGGEHTTTYLDIPRVLGDGEAMTDAGEALLSHLENHDLLDSASMVVGPLTGSIPVVMGLTMTLQRFLVSGKTLRWAILRDKPKTHGLGRWEVGSELTSSDKVILVDDVASTGASLETAINQVQGTGAEILAIVPLVDRAGIAERKLASYYIPYLPVLTYRDLDLPPLGA